MTILKSNKSCSDNIFEHNQQFNSPKRDNSSPKTKIIPYVESINKIQFTKRSSS